MGSLNEMKEKYDNIAIPEELAVRVQQEIMKSRRQQMERESKIHRARFRKAIRGIGAAAAAASILFTLALNTMPAFATEVSQFPVIGGLARVLTFRSYETEKDDIAMSVEIPSIEMIEKDTGIQTDAINQEILDQCNQYAQEAISRAEEYRTAFLDTGGTLEEWAQHNIKIKVDYEIRQQDDEYLSFVVREYENWSSAYNESRYYNLDLLTGKEVTLKDLLGDDYEALANESIREQIAEREKNGEVFFAEDEGGFTSISENTKFYINNSHNPVIVFDKYEIANGAAGEIEFEIGGKHSEK